MVVYVEIGPFITRLTGITNEMAKTGMPDGDAARDFFLTKLPDLVEKHTAAPLDTGPAWKVARVFAGHNFEHFDYPLVYCWGQRNGINVHFPYGPYESPCALCCATVP